MEPSNKRRYATPSDVVVGAHFLSVLIDYQGNDHLNGSLLGEDTVEVISVVGGTATLKTVGREETLFDVPTFVFDGICRPVTFFVPLGN